MDTIPDVSPKRKAYLIGIVAMTTDFVVGKGGALPWRIKEEMQHFVRETKGKTVVMGWNTWKSIGYKPLPGRVNIVINSRSRFAEPDQNVAVTPLLVYGPGVFKIRQLDPEGKLDIEWVEVQNTQALDRYLESTTGDVFVIGGPKTYKMLYPWMANLIVSWIKEPYAGDSYFPPEIFLNFERSRVSDRDCGSFIVREYSRRLA